METSSVLRLGVIAALFLAAVYVLMPTVVQIVDGPDDVLAEQAGAIPDSDQRDDALRVELEAEDPLVAEEAAEVLEQRAQVANVPLERVAVTPEGLEVFLGLGAEAQDIRALAEPLGKVELYDPGGLELQVELDGAPRPTEQPWWGELADLADSHVPSDLEPLDWQAGHLERVDDVLVLPTGELGPAVALVAIDGIFRGAALRAGDDHHHAWPLADASVAEDPQAWPLTFAPVLATPELPTRLAPPEAQVVEAPELTDISPRPSRFPQWLVGMLPDYNINLGIDLQGGIDLSLQVALDEAVMSQARRDATALRDRAERDGLALDYARRPPTEPVIVVGTDAPLSELQRWVASNMGSWEYSHSDSSNEHVFSMREDVLQGVREQAMDQVLETLRVRVDATGVKEPSIVQRGEGRISVQLPGMVDLQSAVDAIGTTAVLEFRMVDEEFDTSALRRMIREAEAELPQAQFKDDLLLNRWLQETGRLSEDHVVLWEYDEVVEGEEVVDRFRARPLPLHAQVILTGHDVAQAGVAWNQQNQPYVSLGFRSRGAQVFCDVTTENVGKRFAIILDNQISSAPNIRERICGGQASIEMGSSLNALEDANTLALVLRTGSLSAPVEIGQVRQVGSTLGQDAIQAGAIATLVGGLLVLIAMPLWYRRAGMVAGVSLLLNMFLVLGALSVAGATLTLPGIAGIALTIGMAVDANIIIFERIREELRLGQHVRRAVDTGFEKALSAILDANITTAIAGIVLFSYGTGPIRGFAVTLLIGIATTLITALFVTRTFMDLLTRSSTSRLTI